MSEKDVITFSCENPSCGCVLYAEPSQVHHVIKCTHCGTKALVPDPLGPKLDDKYLWELPFRERLRTRMRQLYERVCALIERIPAGGAVLIWTIVFMGAWLIIAAPSVPLNFGAVLDEIASVGEIHRVPYSNHDGSRILYARTTEKGVGVYLYEVGSGVSGLGNGESEMRNSEGGVRSEGKGANHEDTKDTKRGKPEEDVVKGERFVVPPSGGSGPGHVNAELRTIGGATPDAVRLGPESLELNQKPRTKRGRIRGSA